MQVATVAEMEGFVVADVDDIAIGMLAYLEGQLTESYSFISKLKLTPIGCLYLLSPGIIFLLPNL